MSLFSSPEEHAANPPHTWEPVKVGREWRLVAPNGAKLERFRTKREALEGRVNGLYAKLWEEERRWYAGEPMPSVRPWADVLAERRKRASVSDRSETNRSETKG